MMFVTFHKRVLFIIIALTILSFMAACSINETEQESLGAIKVTAYDTTQSIEIIGAVIKLDGVTRNETTPAVLKKVKAGSHILEILPNPSDYMAKELDIFVSPPDTTDINASFALIPDPALVSFTTNYDPAMIILNDDFVMEKTTEDTVAIAPGTYEFSVYKDGYKTILPAIQEVVLDFEQEENLTFALEEVAYGNQVGDLFPYFKFPTDFVINETERDSLSIAQFRGRVVLVNFWGYNCSACREEFPAFETLYTERAADGFRVLAINHPTDSDDTFDRFADFREQVNIPSLPLMLNTYGDEFFYGIIGGLSLPQNFLVDQSGIIQYRFLGTNYEELSGFVSELLD